MSHANQITIVLKRKVSLKAYIIDLYLAVSEKRPEIIPILKYVQEKGEPVTPADVAKDLLQREKFVIAGKNILNYLVKLKLLQPTDSSRFTLSVNGQQVLENNTNEIFIPERGTYEVTWTDDPLIKERIIMLKPTSQEIFQYVKNSNESPNKKTDDENMHIIEEKSLFEICPLDQPFVAFFKEKNSENPQKKKIKIERSDGENGDKIYVKVVEKPSEKLNLTIKIDFTLHSPITRFEIEETLHDDRDLPQEVDSMEVWKRILSQHPQSNSLKWDENYFALRVKFSSLNNRERKTFSKLLNFNKIDLSDLGLGTFNDVQVSKIPIIPETLEDALAWAKWLLIEEHLTDYVDTQKWIELIKKIRQKPQFAEFSQQLYLPSRDDLARELFNKNQQFSEKFWYLQAPIDLNPTIT